MVAHCFIAADQRIADDQRPVRPQLWDSRATFLNYRLAAYGLASSVIPMKHPLLHPHRALPAIVALLLVNSLLPATLARWTSAAPRRVIGTVTAAVSAPLHKLSVKVRPPRHDEVISVAQAIAERDALQRLYWKALLDLDEAENLIEQLGRVRLSKLLEKLMFAPAAIASISFDPGHPTITINRGQLNGIEVGQVASSGNDLLGRIASSAPASATVDLITHPGALLDVRVAAADTQTTSLEASMQLRYDADEGVFVGDICALRKGGVRGIHVGDLALLADPRWPSHARAYVVGRITRITQNEQNPQLQRRVIVKPRRDPAKLSHVLVAIGEASHPRYP